MVFSIYTVFSTCQRKKWSQNWWNEKTLCFTMVSASHTQKLAFQKPSETSEFTVFFCSYQEQNCAILRCFLTLKPQNRAKTLVFTMFCNSQKSKRRKTPLFATLSQHNMSGTVSFPVLLDHLLKSTGNTVFWENTCIKHRKHQQIQGYIFHGNKPKEAKTLT